MTKLAAAEGVFDGPVLSESAVWLDERRSRALETIRRQGVPNRRFEEWKYSDLKSALEAANDITVGRVEWKLSSLPEGSEIVDLGELTEVPEWVREHFGKSATESSVPAASFVYGQSGFALRVPRGTAASVPARMDFLGSGHARVLLVLEEGANLTVVETPSSSGFSNIGIEVVAGRGTKLTLVRFAAAAPSSIQLEDVAVRLARNAEFRAHVVNAGALLARLNLRMTLKEPGASAFLSGASAVGGALHSDVTTHVYHASGETRSTQLFKHAVGGKGRAVYQGKITVAEGANGSDSRQTARAVLLSPRAEADLKPELEIFADDVKCAHGAAIGDLDPDALFYLRARGIDETGARNLLVRAFLEDGVAPIEGEAVRNEAQEKLRALVGRLMEEKP